MDVTRTFSIVQPLPESLWISTTSGRSSADVVLSRQRPGAHRMWMNAVSGRPAFAGSMRAW